ncbi:MAG: hypothetical protein QGG64_24575, partial [Candidatus Latescibacteria bacterium]|nr:hypothetical protein [Candidatus Latescibacterota bacterium]
WDQTLQSLQRAPDPDPFVPNIVNGQFDWRGITYKDGTQVKDKNGNPFGVSTPQNPYPVNKGGIEIDRWLETQFIVNTSKKKCKAPPKITAGQTVTISAETLDLIPPGTSIANIVVDNVPKVTFTLIGGADRFELENKSGTTGHQVIEDTAENGIAEITLKPTEEDSDADQVLVFVHAGLPPEDGVFHRVQGALCSIDIIPDQNED